LISLAKLNEGKKAEKPALVLLQCLGRTYVSSEVLLSLTALALGAPLTGE